MGRRVRGIPAFIRCEWTEAKERKIRVSCTDRERERERERESSHLTTNGIAPGAWPGSRDGDVCRKEAWL
jgi:hypothetical protein